MSGFTSDVVVTTRPGVLAAASCVAVLASCSSLPDVTYSYYPSVSNTVVTVTQTVDCNSARTALIWLNAPSISTTYAADYSKQPSKVRIKGVEGWGAAFVDSDVSFTFFDDGRLKSVNQSTTGQGETIVKSAISLASSLALLGGGGKQAAPGATIPECKDVADWGGGKPVSLTYSGSVNVATKLGQAIGLSPAPSSAALHDKLKAKLPTLDIFVNASTPIQGRGSFTSGSDGSFVALTLQETANVQVDVRADGSVVGSGNVTVPLPSTYDLPIPAAALFGRQNFSLTLNEAGGITTIDYGKNTGAAGALNVINAAATAAAPESVANQAADVKAQADLIAQQQRLARCQAKPAQCQ